MIQQDVTFLFPRNKNDAAETKIKLEMVRNIDLVEALIFYGGDSLFGDIWGRGDDDSSWQPSLLDGVEYLLDECKRDETAVIVILEDQTFIQRAKECLNAKYPIIQVKEQTQRPPSPADLWYSIHDTTIQPKGFGGSSGFGTKAADPERSPLPKHCVVLCTTENQCRAARFAGMRVLCLNDNSLADGVLDLDWSSLGMDDIATPGSFWLNPPHPKDDNGDKVDVEAVIEAYQLQAEQVMGEAQEDTRMSAENPIVLTSSDFTSDELSDAELSKLLADIDPL